MRSVREGGCHGVAAAKDFGHLALVLELLELAKG
jgi:hypothetical protein